MRCNEIREILEQESSSPIPPGVRRHLAACPECRAYAAGFTGLTEGMKLLAQEPVPEPSIGFSARLLYRLNEEAARDFLENAGRRVVYATLILVAVLLLVMILPSSGPVRRSPNLENYWPQQESVEAGNYQIPMERLSPVPVLVDVESSTPSGR